MSQDSGSGAGGGYSGSFAASGSAAQVTPQNQWAGTVIAFASSGVTGGQYDQTQSLSTKPSSEATSAYGGSAYGGAMQADDASPVSGGKTGTPDKTTIYIAVASMLLTAGAIWFRK